MQGLNDIKGTRQPENSNPKGKPEVQKRHPHRELDLAKTRNVNKQQREDEEASTPNAQRAE